MKRINPDGCARCEVVGWKHEPYSFCACPCHNGGPTLEEQLEAKGIRCGATFYSTDLETWTTAPPPAPTSDAPVLVVTKVDYRRGEVTLSVKEPNT